MADGEGGVAGEAGPIELVIGLAEDTDCIALVVLQVEPVVALDAEVEAVVGVAILDLELLLHRRHLAHSLQDAVPRVATHASLRSLVEVSTLRVNQDADTA